MTDEARATNRDVIASTLFSRITSLRHHDNVDAAYECESGIDRCHDCESDFGDLTILRRMAR